jgi:RND family efflux transporter MFP subunit
MVHHLFEGRHRRIAVPIAVVGLAALAACSGPPPAPQARTASFVHAIIVSRVGYSSQIVLSGEIQAQHELSLSFRTSGRIAERLVDTGAQVSAGQVLARIDPGQQQGEVDAANAALLSAQVQAQQTAAALTRQQTLLAQGVTTKSQYEQALEGSQSAQGALTAAQSALATAKDSLSFAELKSPVSGILISRTADVGETAVAGQPVFTLAVDGPRDAVFKVPESVVLQAVDPGSVKIFVTSDPSITTPGSFTQVSPALSSTTGTIEVKLGLDHPPAAMSLGTAITATVDTKSVPSIVLPSAALVSDGASPGIWVIDPTTHQVGFQKITIASFSASSVVVASGVEVGQQVVTDGAKLLHPGELVTAGSPT